jgi:hypothetical protein
MNINLEKLIILLIIGVFIVTSVNSLNALGNPITKEEAIEISKNSELVKEGIGVALKFTVEANYYNSSMVEQLKIGHSGEMYEKVPEGHSIWEVIWWFTYKEKPGAYDVIVVVDAETGTITYETKGIELY